jgi:hypothetical protein
MMALCTLIVGYLLPETERFVLKGKAKWSMDLRGKFFFLTEWMASKFGS